MMQRGRIWSSVQGGEVGKIPSDEHMFTQLGGNSNQEISRHPSSLGTSHRGKEKGSIIRKAKVVQKRT